MTYQAQVMKRIKRFVVEGGGEFPFDMLRYDSAWPASERDVSTMTDGMRRRKVSLLTVTERLTIGRWESFQWKVVEDLHHSIDGLVALAENEQPQERDDA